jgi:hypothetical protein
MLRGRLGDTQSQVPRALCSTVGEVGRVSPTEPDSGRRRNDRQKPHSAIETTRSPLRGNEPAADLYNLVCLPGQDSKEDACARSERRPHLDGSDGPEQSAHLDGTTHANNGSRWVRELIERRSDHIDTDETT